MTPRLKKLLLLQGGAGGWLPKGFTELDYLESSGTQYIDTKITGNSETAVRSKFQAVYKASEGMRVYGSYSAGRHITFYASKAGGNCRFGNETQLVVVPDSKVVTTIQDKSGVLVNGEFFAYGQGVDF